MDMNEVILEIGMAIESKEYYFQRRNKSPFDDLMFQFWCGVEIGLTLASGKLEPTLSKHYYGMSYKEYYHRCKCYFHYGLDGKGDKK